MNIQDELEKIEYVKRVLFGLSDNFDSTGNEFMSEKLYSLGLHLDDAKEGIEKSVKENSVERLQEARNLNGSILSALLHVADED